VSQRDLAARIRAGQHIPDILDCLAQLSNDEVPTPPKLARAVLDGLPADVWGHDDYRWLDPFSKSGVFLREAALRLLEGLADQWPDFQKRREHIYRQMLWGNATTEMTGIISRRSLYYSRDASGPASVIQFEQPDGNLAFVRSSHTFVKNKDGTITTGCRICGGALTLERGEGRENYAYSFIHGGYPTEEIKDMKFDVIVGNPPYHLEDEGFGTSSQSIYQLFVEQAKRLNPRLITMIIPSRWFAGGKGLDSFRESMLGDKRLRSIDDFLSASDAFPGIGLKGGVSYFLWDRDNPGPCRVTTRFKDWPVSTATRPLLEPGADVFIRFNEGVSILKKVAAVELGNTASVSLPANKRFDRLVSSRKPFGLGTTFRGKATRGPGDVKVLQNGGVGWVSKDSLNAGVNLIDGWKIFVSYAAPGTGNKDTYPHRIISTPFVGEPGTICSETYIAIGPFGSKAAAESALSYLSCRLTRFLILLHKPSQHVTRKVYSFVPTQSWDTTWTDAALYEKYGLNEDEIAFVEKIVRPMDLSGDDDADD
jgi:hypothetical protein